MSLLVISPHMDDETFGAGGTMIKYAQQGQPVYWLNISNTKEEYGYPKELVEKRSRQFDTVAEKLGVMKAIDWKLQPAHLSEYPAGDQIGRLAKLMDELRPDTIISPYYGDIHSDHGTVYSWIKAVSKSFRNPFLKRLMLMEVISETDFAMPDQVFRPNFFIDISDQMEQKMEAISVYSQEIGEHPFPRSLKNIYALGTSRGAVAGVGCAEAFMLIRGIEK